MKSASSESRNATSAATSSSLPGRPIGIVDGIAAIRPGGTEATIRTTRLARDARPDSRCGFPAVAQALP